MGSLIRLCALVLGASILGASATAQPDQALLRGFGVPSAQAATSELSAIQTDLAWIGHFRGIVTGQGDRRTLDAVRAFQIGLGNPATGTLSNEERRLAAQRARETEVGYGFARRRLDWLGVEADLPMSILGAPELSGRELGELTFSASHTSRLVIELWTYSDGNVAPSTMLRVHELRLQKSVDEDAETELVVHGSGVSGRGFFTDATMTNDRRRLTLGEQRGNEWRVIELVYQPDQHDAVRPVVNRILRSLDLFAGPALSLDERRARWNAGVVPGFEDVPDWFNSMIGNGSGSIVSRNGEILTNQHVVNGCARLTVNGTPAVLVGFDARLDLALIRAPEFANRTPVRFREANPQLGEAISVMGYPVFRSSRSVNFTNGIVSSAVGLYGDRTRVQITAPVQPGNSGGPVLDSNGTQIAVVVAKASAAFQVRDNIENVAWVIRGRQAVEFLQRHGVRPLIEQRPLRDRSPTPGEVLVWRQFTVRIECHDT